MLEQLISDKLKELAKAELGVELNEKQIQFQKTRKEFEGDITLVVFPFVKLFKKSPEQVAEQIGNYFKGNITNVSDYNVVKGFLNISISSEFWLNQLNEISLDTNFGTLPASGQTYMVEYSSPNTNKPLHLGHLRNNFLGYSVADILKANGHQVYKTQIINDRGIHICKSMVAWLKYGNGETPESTGMKGDKLVGKYYVEFDKHYKAQVTEMVEQGVDEKEAKITAPILQEAQELLRKWEAKDTEVYELWKTMNGWVYEGFAVTYKTMGVDFDKLYYESDTYLLGKDIVAEGLGKGIFYKKDDGSVWCDLTEDGLDEKLVLRSDGTAVYMTQDIGTAIERFKDYPDLNGLIYTVGNEQDYHFKVLFLILKKLGFDWANECSHLSYGMVDLPSGKMKSREGTVVDADDLMAQMIADAKTQTDELGKLGDADEQEKTNLYDMIGLGALKYFILKVDPKKRMLFNPEESIDLQGNTGPFIQYGHARIKSILRRVEGELSSVNTNVSLESIELELIKNLSAYPAIIAEAGKNLSPAIIANYTYDLVKMFNSFYQSISILNEENEEVKNMRLQLSKAVSEVIKSAMLLLGINVPERM